MKVLRRTLVVGLFVLVLWTGWRFAYDNAEPISVNYIFGEIPKIRLWKALLAACGLGAAGMAVLLGIELARARLEARRYRKLVERLESQLKQQNPPPAAEKSPPSVIDAESASARRATLAQGGDAGRSV